MAKAKATQAAGPAGTLGSHLVAAGPTLAGNNGSNYLLKCTS